MISVLFLLTMETNDHFILVSLKKKKEILNGCTNMWVIIRCHCVSPRVRYFCVLDQFIVLLSKVIYAQFINLSE